MDKWILVSNLQKAIRRGQTDIAIETATKLWTFDNAYLRYRTSVILVEDIGIANADLLVTAFEGKLGKRWLDAKGGLPWFLENVIIPAAESIKDRSSCDWGVVSKNDLTGFQQRYGAFEELSLDTAETIIEKSTSLTDKGLAAWRISGTDIYPHDSLPKNIKGDWSRWLEINKEMGVSDKVINVMTMSQKSQREWHPIYLGLSELESKVSKVVEVDLKNPVSDGILLPACDIHTSAGKTAMTKYLNRNTELRDVLNEIKPNITYENLKIAIGKLVFLLDGGKVSKYIEYNNSKAIDLLAKQQWQNFFKLPGNKIATVVWKTFPLLQECQIETIKDIYRKEEYSNGPGFE